MKKPWDDAPYADNTGIETKKPWDDAPYVDNTGTGATPFMNQAIVKTAGAPVDIATAGINIIPGVDIKEPFLGSASIAKNMSKIRYGDPDQPIHERKPLIPLPEEGRTPQTRSEYIGQSVGEVATMMIPVAKTAQMLSKGAGLIGNISKTVVNSMVKHPYITMSSELAGGTGSGIGRDIGEDKFQDAPLTKTAVEFGSGLIGGLSPTVMVNAPQLVALRQGKKLLTKMSLPFTKKGSEYRAGEFLKGNVPDPNKAVKTLGDETIGKLPPVIASGEKRLVGLYKNFTALDPATDAKTIESLSKSIITLEKEMRKLGYGSPNVLAEITKKRVAAIELGMDKRVIDAMETAQTKLEKLPVAHRKVNESRIVRAELENVRKSEQAKTQQKWDDVSKDFPVGVKSTKKAYTDIVDSLSQAQKSDIPPVLKNSFIIQDKTTKTSIKEMQGLRSKLLESARLAQKNGKWNKARIAKNMADAILEDIGISAKGTTSPEAAQLQAALSSTQHNKKRFEQGIVGKLLGYGDGGVPAIDPDLTLDMSVGRMGQKGSIDIEKIAITPEAVEATKRYLGRSYVKFATDSKGEIIPHKSKSWIETNEAILDKFPGMRKQLSDIGDAQNFANNTKVKMDARKKALRDPKISTSARFLNAADMDVAVDSILKAKNPAKMAAELVRQTKQDPTGDALQGLRGGFINHFMDKASVGAFNELGEQTLSGRVFLNMLKQEKATLHHIFTPEQISRMRRIGTELSRIETFDKTPAKKADIKLDDMPSTALRLFSRVGGAQIGRVVAKYTGGGTVQTPGIFSERFRAFATSLSKDKAAQLVNDAIMAKDPALLKSLLLPISKPKAKSTQKNLSVLNKQINFWLADTGRRVLNEFNNEEQP